MRKKSKEIKKIKEKHELALLKWGIALKRYLRANKIRFQDFAKEVGVHNTTISRWVNGKEFPTYVNAKLVEKLTNGKVPVSLLYP